MTEVAVRDERTPAEILIANVRSEQFQQQVSLALPGPGGPERFVRAAVTLLQSTPDIAKADLGSVSQSLIRCAQDGLLPDGREAAIVVYRTKDKATNEYVEKAQYLRMIGGVRKLAAEFGWSIRTAVVYEHDEFEEERGLEPKLTHRPVRPGAERGPMIAAYAIATKPGRQPEFLVMYASEIEKARQSSRSRDRGPWVDWPERMWEKTVGHALFKQLPLGDLDLERERLLRDEMYGQEPTETLYGQPQLDARVVGELGPGEPVPTTSTTPASLPADSAAPSPADAGQQAEGGAEAQAGAAPAPDPEPDPTASDDAPSGPGAHVVPSGTVQGYTLAQIAGMEQGPAWFQWASKPKAELDDTTRAAVAAYLEQHPEVLA